MMFLGCSSRRMTSSTVVLRMADPPGAAPHVDSSVSGVYPVIRKWQRGVGMRLAMSPTRSLFM